MVELKGKRDIQHGFDKIGDLKKVSEIFRGFKI